MHGNAGEDLLGGNGQDGNTQINGNQNSSNQNNSTDQNNNSNQNNNNAGPAAGYKAIFTVEDVIFKMAYVPGGLSFPIAGEYEDDGIATVAEAYWIGETEVTYELWAKVTTWALDNGYSFANTGGYFVSTSEPVTGVNWRDAMVFSNALTEWYNATQGTSYVCVYKAGGIPIRDSRDSNAAQCDAVTQNTSANGFRLLTSNEWELAARYKGNDSSNGSIEYPVSSGMWWTPGTYASGAGGGMAATFEVAWFLQKIPIDKFAPQGVGQLRANALGVYDMSGNVWEWTFDPNNDFGPGRVDRGGCWTDIFVDLSFLDQSAPTSIGDDLGFRIARSAN